MPILQFPTDTIVGTVEWVGSSTDEAGPELARALTARRFACGDPHDASRRLIIDLDLAPLLYWTRGSSSPTGRLAVKRVLACLIMAAASFILVAPGTAWATAWGAWAYEVSVPVSGSWADFCARAGIVDIASNQVNEQTHANPGRCSGTTRNLPSGYFAGSLSGYRNGAFCGTSGTGYSNVATWGITFKINMCSNPSGTQTFYTVGHAGVFDDGSDGCGNPCVGYLWFNRTSPSQNY